MSSSPSIHSSLSCERISVSIPTTSAGGEGGVGHHQDLCEFSSDLDYAFGAASAAADLPSSSTTATSAESNLNHHCQDQDDFQENNNLLLICDKKLCIPLANGAKLPNVLPNVNIKYA